MPDELIIAIALILVLEGALYALFPNGMRRMALQLERIPVSSLRSAGLLSAIVGVGIIWLVRNGPIVGDVLYCVKLVPVADLAGIFGTMPVHKET